MMPFNYLRALDEDRAIAAAREPDAHVLAGATTLVDLLPLELMRPRPVAALPRDPPFGHVRRRRRARRRRPLPRPARRAPDRGRRLPYAARRPPRDRERARARRAGDRRRHPGAAAGGALALRQGPRSA